MIHLELIESASYFLSGDDVAMNRLNRGIPKPITGYHLDHEGEATRAASCEADGLAILTHIRSEKLIRLIGSEDCPKVDTYHDKIRENVLGRLESQQRRKWHSSLANVIAAVSSIELTEKQLTGASSCLG